MKFSYLAFILFIFSTTFAQKGTITGIITDKESKNAGLPFANAVLKGTSFATVTDENGNYTMSVPAGDYTIVFSFLGYDNAEMPVTVKANEIVTISKALGSGAYTLKDVTVQATASREKETALLLEQKKAVEIKQSIGAQEMARKGVSDVEEGLTKITGITKVGSRGLFVRGLEDRYNNLLINDLAAPTNNPFKKIIPLDLFPSDIISVIEVYKTFNPNIYGDFAGGTFDIQTPSNIKSVSKISIGAGFVTNNNLEKFLISEEADDTKGFFGFNGDTREIPDALGNKPKGKTLTQAQAAGLDGFNVTETKSPLNSSIGILHSEKFRFKNDAAFSYLLSLNFDNAYTYRNGPDRTLDVATTGNKFNTNFNTSFYRYKTAKTGLLVLNYNAERLKVTGNMLFIKTTDNTITDQFGSPEQNLNNRLIRTNQLETSDYLNGQLLGEYALSKDKRHMFRAGYSLATTKYEQPDRKSFEGTKANIDDPNITLVYGGNNFLRQYLTIDGNWFFSALAEYSLKFGNSRQNKISIGYNGSGSDMQSSYRFISAESETRDFTTNANHIDDRFIPDLASGIVRYRDNSSSTYKVKLAEFANAGYANVLFKFMEKLEINAGARVESTTRETKYRKLGPILPFLKKHYDNLYILPSLNMKYAATEEINIRFAASKTYTRPVILEAFPLTYINPDGTSIQGNPILENSDNYNADLKFEIFPTAKEIFAVGLFGKYLKNPIERAFIANATTSTVTSYLNSDNARLYGVEGEFIVSLGRINQALSDLSFGMNVAWMSTQVNVNPTYSTQDEDGKITSTATIETFRNRKLQGASNLILNSDLKYQFDFSKSWSNTLSAVYSIFSKRIYALGTNGQDHTFELPFSQIDIVWQSKLSEHLDLKLTADNILNPEREIEFGDGGKFNIAEDSHIYQSYKKGVGFSAGLSYTF